VSKSAQKVQDSRISAIAADLIATGVSAHLQLAVRSEDQRLVRILVRAGANPDLRDLSVFTPLMYATFQESEPIIQILLEAGADVQARYSGGETVLHIAVRAGCSAGVFDLLLKYISDAQGESRGGETAPHRPAHHDYANLAGVGLLGSKSHVGLEATDKWGLTPLLTAICAGQLGALRRGSGSKGFFGSDSPFMCGWRLGNKTTG
jgi:ankyrin repeat protein